VFGGTLSLTLFQLPVLPATGCT